MPDFHDPRGGEALPGSVLLIDDHVVIAQAMAEALRGAGYDPVEYVGEDAFDVESILTVAERLRPDVALVDLNLGAGRSGFPLIGPLVGRGVKVVAFTASDDPLAMARCVEAGATAFLHKASPFDALLLTIDRVLAGEELISQHRRQELLAVLRSFRDADDSRLARLAALTPREQEVLKALMAGHTAARIAEDSYVSIRTVRTHIEAIHRKLGVKSQLSAVAFAREVGWPREG
ncbi:MAG: response regulator transcription factor [Actinobacteria bacterium]|nr:response regulator transcription factor [Actinomycetota bacterium]